MRYPPLPIHNATYTNIIQIKYIDKQHYVIDMLSHIPNTNTEPPTAGSPLTIAKIHGGFIITYNNIQSSVVLTSHIK